MNEIPHITTNHAEPEHEISASHILAAEAYANEKQKPLVQQENVANPREIKGGENSEQQPGQFLPKKRDEVQPEPYYRLGHTEDESFRHVVQTWRHVLTGNCTKLELLEFGIEAAGAAAMIRFGVKKLWPMKAMSKASVASAGDETILSQTLTGAQARNHPVMRMHIRTNEAPTIVPR